MSRLRTAVLISGRGSNLAALLDAVAGPDYPAEIALVLSNRPDAGGLHHAVRHGVATAVIDHKSHPDRSAFEVNMQAALDQAGVEFLCLAGFMRLLTPEFVARWHDRMINVHPSLLPSFKGLATHEQALAAGVRIHGATVHFVRTAMDTGPIIMQGAVPILPDDTQETLAARVLAVEHRIYPAALAAVASGKARVLDDRVVWPGDTARRDSAVLIAPDVGSA